jgi:hypothetical protein
MAIETLMRASGLSFATRNRCVSHETRQQDMQILWFGAAARGHLTIGSLCATPLVVISERERSGNNASASQKRFIEIADEYGTFVVPQPAKLALWIGQLAGPSRH